MICSSQFSFGFWSLLAMRLQKYENVYIFARQDGQDRKKRKENHATKVTKIPKTKRQKNWMNETKVTLILTL